MSFSFSLLLVVLLCSACSAEWHFCVGPPGLGALGGAGSVRPCYLPGTRAGQGCRRSPGALAQEVRLAGVSSLLPPLALPWGDLPPPAVGFSPWLGTRGGPCHLRVLSTASAPALPRASHFRRSCFLPGPSKPGVGPSSAYSWPQVSLHRAGSLQGYGCSLVSL